LRLHNFLVDYREEIGGTSTTKEKRFEREELNVASDDFLMENPYDMLGPLSESDEMRKTGRPTTAEARERVRGKAVRDSICDALHWGGVCTAFAAAAEQHNSSRQAQSCSGKSLKMVL
jgi:cytochrome c5